MFLFLSFMFGCSTNPTVETKVVEPVKPTVLSTSFPADYLMRRVGGENINGSCLSPAGVDPVTWSPSPDEIAKLNQVDLIIANGAGFEKWMETAALPSSKTIYSADGVELIYLESETHSHGKQGEHSHAGKDPHTWSDPISYLKQADNVRKALKNADPSAAETYDKNYQNLEKDLKALDAETRNAAKDLKNKPMAASHPAFNYLAKRFELKIKSFDFEPEIPPTPTQLGVFNKWSMEHQSNILLWESEPIKKVKDAFPKEIKHVFVDPLEQPAGDEGYDYIKQSKANVLVLKTLVSELHTAEDKKP